MTEKDKRVLKYAIDNLIARETCAKDLVKTIQYIEQNVNEIVI